MVAVVGLAGWGLSLAGCSGTPAAGASALDRKVDCSGDCLFSEPYTIGTSGYFASNADTFYLAPTQGYMHSVLVIADGGTTAQVLSCGPAIPPCGGDAGVMSACDIAQDLADPVVQSALAQSSPVFFGADTRGTDGNAFKFSRSDGHGFLVGDGVCSSTDKNCAVPPAIARLKADLQALDGELIASPECQALGVRLKVAGNG